MFAIPKVSQGSKKQVAGTRRQIASAGTKRQIISAGTKRQFSRSGTFADLLVRHVRDRGGDAPAVYTAAMIDRRTFSAIVSHPFRPVAKRTAIQFAIALKLDRASADELLRSAGFALSPAIPEDVIFAKAIDQGGGDLLSVSEMLYDQGLKAI